MHSRSNPSSYLECLGYWKCFSMIWRATPHLLKVIALPYCIITYTRLLAKSGDPDRLRFLHATMFKRSVMFRLMRPRYRIMKQLLGRLTTRTNDSTHHEIVGSEVWERCNDCPPNRDTREARGQQPKTIEQEQQTISLEPRQSLEIPRVSIHRRCGCDRNKGQYDLVQARYTLSHDEQQRFLDRLHSERATDLTPVLSLSLPDKQYFGAMRTSKRTSTPCGDVSECNTMTSLAKHNKWNLSTIRPNRVWSRDIIILKGHLKWNYCHLHDCLNTLRRYAVGGMIDEQEFTKLVRCLILENGTQENSVSGQLILHTDQDSTAAIGRTSPARRLIRPGPSLHPFWLNSYWNSKDNSLTELMGVLTPAVKKVKKSWASLSLPLYSSV